MAVSGVGASRFRNETGRKRRLVLAPVLVAVMAATLLVATPPLAQAAEGDGHNEYLSDHPVPDEYGSGEAAVVSGDGWHVAFTSADSYHELDQVSGSRDVYVRDRARNTTVLISQLPESVDPDQVHSDQPSISANGRYVAFRTTSPRMGAAMDPDAGVGLYVADVYVCDRDPDGDGDFDEVLPDGTRDYGYASVGAKLEQGLEEGGGSDGISSVTSWPVISADGSSVAWEHHPDGTDADAPTVSVHVTRLGFGPGGRLLVQRLGGGPVAPAPAARPVISADGDYVTVLVEGRVVGVVLGDRAPRREEVLSVDENGALITSVHGPSAMSNDAHIVAFEHGKSESSGNSAIYNIVVRVVDRDPDSDDIPWPATGEPFTSRIASFDLRSGEGETTQAYSPSLSGDGRFLAFKAWDGGFLEGRLPDCSVPESCPPSDSDCAGCQIVARDLAFDRARVEAGLPLTSAYVVTQTTQECTPEDGRWQTGPCMGNSSSSTSSISADGGVIAFATRANNLAEGDDNSWSDVYARVLTPGVTGVSPTFTPVRPDGDVTGVVRFEYGTGFGPAHITGASVTGADSDEFTVGTANTCSGRAVYPGETCRVPVRFRPTGEAGTRTAQLELDVHGRAEPIVVPLEAAVDQPLVGPVLAVGSLDVAFGQRAIMASSEDTAPDHQPGRHGDDRHRSGDRLHDECGARDSTRLPSCPTHARTWCWLPVKTA